MRRQLQGLWEQDRKAFGWQELVSVLWAHAHLRQERAPLDALAAEATARLAEPDCFAGDGTQPLANLIWVRSLRIHISRFSPANFPGHNIREKNCRRALLVEVPYRMDTVAPILSKPWIFQGGILRKCKFENINNGRSVTGTIPS